MNRLSIFSEKTAQADDIRRSLAGLFEVRILGLERMLDLEPEEFTVVDVSLKQTARLLDIKDWLKRKPRDGKAIFAVDKSSRIEVARAYSIGATDVVERPIDSSDLLGKLKVPRDSATRLGNFAVLAGDVQRCSFTARRALPPQSIRCRASFPLPASAQTIDTTVVAAAGEAIVGQIDAQGLASWVDVVRRHHSQTYQHCMLVTGVAVAFGQHIGLSKKDRQRLSFAGMLHDIGKARIPLEILEKPGPLDKEEMAVMRQHPQLGVDSLGSESGLSPEMIDMVLHHHEHLDGSGYPHGLQAGEIADLVRIMTISDVFGALIERRSYKPPLSSAAAYQILLDMGPKLDKHLVREFGFVTQLDGRQ